MSLDNDVNDQESARDGLDGSGLGLGLGLGLPIFVEIPVNNGPISSIATSPDGSRLMVTNYGHNSVSIIDTDSCRVLETVAGVDEPFAIAVGGPGLFPTRVGDPPAPGPSQYMVFALPR